MEAAVYSKISGTLYKSTQRRNRGELNHH